MIVAGFLFTLTITYIIYKVISIRSVFSSRKPTSTRLIYWGCLLFISIIFNMLIYASGPYSYKLSLNIQDESIYALLWLILSFLLIQLLSPSMFLRRFLHFIKSSFITSKTKPQPVRDYLYNSEPSSSNHNNNQLPTYMEFEEKDFELFLNTLCWLSFTFVILVYLISAIIPLIVNETELGLNFKEQLNYICRILVFCTLPITLRQILFYLLKLKKSSLNTKHNIKHNFTKYERYLTLKKNLRKSLKKL